MATLCLSSSPTMFHQHSSLDYHHRRHPPTTASTATSTSTTDEKCDFRFPNSDFNHLLHADIDMPPSCKVAAAVVPGHCLKKGPIYSGGSSDDCDLLLDLLQDDQDEDNDQEMEDLMSSVNLEDSANFLDLSLSNHNDDAADALPTTTTVGHNLPLFSYCDSLYHPKHHVYVWDDEFSLLHKAKTHKLCRVQEEDEEDQEEDCHLYLGNKKEV